MLYWSRESIGKLAYTLPTPAPDHLWNYVRYVIVFEVDFHVAGQITWEITIDERLGWELDWFKRSFKFVLLFETLILKPQIDLNFVSMIVTYCFMMFHLYCIVVYCFNELNNLVDCIVFHRYIMLCINKLKDKSTWKLSYIVYLL